MGHTDPGARRRWEIVGWVLFLVCALLFTAVGLRDGDGLTLAASGVFLLACLFFLLPLLRAGGDAPPAANAPKDRKPPKP